MNTAIGIFRHGTRAAPPVTSWLTSSTRRPCTMSSWEASEPAGKGVVWCVKPRSSDDPAPKVCCLCAPPPLCYAVFVALAIAEIVLASLAGHILGICVGCCGVLVSLFACGGTLGVVAVVLARRDAQVCRAVSTRWKPQLRIRMTLLFFGVLFLTVWIILLAAIRVVGDSDSTFDTFPSSCSLPDGCTRVAFSEGGAQGTHRCSMDGTQCKVPKVAALVTTVREDVVKELDSWFQV